MDGFNDEAESGGPSSNKKLFRGEIIVLSSGEPNEKNVFSAVLANVSPWAVLSVTSSFAATIFGAWADSFCFDDAWAGSFCIDGSFFFRVTGSSWCNNSGCLLLVA